MDALALLCTLHADGPTTLRRLREIGMERLEDLESQPALTLAELISVEPRTMRRLIREARLLQQRMGFDLEDVEESPNALGFGDAAPKLHEPQTPTIPATKAVPEPRLRSPEPALAAVPQSSAQHAPGSRPGPAAESEQEEDPMDPEDNENEVIVQPVARGERLMTHEVDGLSEPLIAKLAREGIHSVEQLARTDGWILASALGMPFTQLRRLQFLARQASDSAARSEREGHDPAGPFA